MKRSETKLQPILGLFDATAIGIGAIIGGGIFVVTGIVAGLAGPALIVSILIAAVIAALTALSLADLTSWLPVEGSVYEYAHRLVSPSAGFLTGWMWIVSNTFAGAAVSLGFAYYFSSLFPGVQPKLIAVAICLAFTALNYAGVRQSTALNNILVSAKIVILIIFVSSGLFHIQSGNFTPFIPSEPGVLYGTFFIFFAYGGFARVAVVSEEVKDAKRVVPRAMILSLVISSVIYVLVGAVSVGLIGAGNLGRSSSPLVDAIKIVGSPALVYVISFGGMIATASVLLTSILGVSRVAYAMARRKDLPSALGMLHPKHNTPHFSILMVGGIMTMLALLVDLSAVVAVSTFAQLFYYGSANLSAIRLNPGARLYPRFLSVIGLATCVLLIAFVSPSALIIGVISLACGAAYYYAVR